MAKPKGGNERTLGRLLVSEAVGEGVALEDADGVAEALPNGQMVAEEEAVAQSIQAPFEHTRAHCKQLEVESLNRPLSHLLLLARSSRQNDDDKNGDMKNSDVRRLAPTLNLANLLREQQPLAFGT